MNDLIYSAVWGFVMLPFLLFSLYYGLTPPRRWVREPVGRSLMILSTSMVAVLSLAILRRLAKDDGWVFFLFFWPAVLGISLGGWYLFRNLRHLQRQAKRIHQERLSRERAASAT